MRRLWFWALLAAVTLLAAGTLLRGVPVLAQDPKTELELERYRQMLKEDPWSNPGNLDVDRGQTLWTAKRGPNDVSLEGCDLGKGPGVVAGAFAELPRYFADADRVLDAEARVVWCMEKLQGLSRQETVQPWPGSGQPTTDAGAIATYIASKSNGMTLAPRNEHPKEKEMLALGEELFFRRQGPMDFSCSTCHAEKGKRIRLQALPFLSEAEEARKVIGEWPAYRVSASHVMTMQHRIYDCYWQMRLPKIDFGSDVTIALTMYLNATASGGEISVPGLKR